MLVKKKNIMFCIKYFRFVEWCCKLMVWLIKYRYDGKIFLIIVVYIDVFFV